MTGVRARLLAFTALAASTGAVMIGGVAAAETLGDALALAYQTNPALLAARADQRGLDERYIQAVDALGPTASVSAEHGEDAASVKQAGAFSSSPSTTYNRAITGSAQLTLNQPLYTGGQLTTAISAARADVLGGRQNLRQVETSVLNQVVTAYADLLFAQDMIAISKQDVQALRSQLDETQARVAVKDLTLTDLAQAKARLVAAELKLSQVRSQLSDSEAKYQAVVGQPPGQLEPLPDLPGMPPTLGDALDAAQRANPALLAEVYAELASRARVAEAKASDGLQIGVTASWSEQPLAPYLSHQLTKSVTGAFVINKPLFTSGLHTSRVREAIESDNRDDLKLADGRRQITSAVIQAWNDLAEQRQILLGLNQQLGEEGRAFEGSRIEARIGLRTTIDVLNAEQELQATKASLAQAYHDEYLTRVSLLADMGVLQIELLDPRVTPYRPEQSLYRRNAMSRAMPWEAVVAALDGIGAPSMAAQAPNLDPLGEGRSSGATPMPGTPRWEDLAKYLAEQPTELVREIPAAKPAQLVRAAAPPKPQDVSDLDGLRPAQSPGRLSGSN